MAFNFASIIEEETKRAEESSNNKQNSGYPLVYPFNTGKLEFRPIGNEVSGLLYRELFRHEFISDGRKQKVPCLNRNYGMDCPVCNMIQKVQDTFNDKYVFGKYGIKRRGILYARLISYEPANYFGDMQNPPKPGDIIMLMLPKAAVDELAALNKEFSDSLEELYTYNTARSISLTITMGNNGFKDYNFYVKNKSYAVCTNPAGEPDDAAFTELMRSMPDLREYSYSLQSPSEDHITTLKTIVEQMNREYFAGGATSPVVGQTGTYFNQPQTPITPVNPAPNMQAPVNPIPVQTPQPQAVPQPIPQPVANTPVQSTTPGAPANPPVVTTAVESSDTQQVPLNETMNDIPPVEEVQRPECFGNNKYDGTCAACPWDNECV